MDLGWAQSALPGVASFAGSLFGLNKAKPDPYYKQMQGVGFNGLTNIANQAGALGNQYAAFQNYTQPAYLQQLRNTQSLLSQDPYTDSYRTARINQATAGLGSAYQQAAANLQASLAARGLDTSGLMAGGLASLEGSHASALASPMLSVGMDAVNQRRQNSLDLLGALSSADQYASGLRQNALGLQSSAYGSLLGNATTAQAQDLDNKYRQQNYWQQMIGSLGGVLGTRPPPLLWAGPDDVNPSTRTTA